MNPTKRLTLIVATLTVCAAAAFAQGAQHEDGWAHLHLRDAAWSQMGFAIAATKACPKLKISAEGMKALAASLDAEDQAEVFTNPGPLEYVTGQAEKTLALAGDAACDIALEQNRKARFKLLEPN